jgi:hypothetical protein
MAITVLYLYHSPESKSCVGTPGKTGLPVNKGGYPGWCKRSRYGQEIRGSIVAHLRKNTVSYVLFKFKSLFMAESGSER